MEAICDRVEKENSSLTLLAAMMVVSVKIAAVQEVSISSFDITFSAAPPHLATDSSAVAPCCFMFSFGGHECLAMPAPDGRLMVYRVISNISELRREALSTIRSDLVADSRQESRTSLPIRMSSCDDCDDQSFDGRRSSRRFSISSSRKENHEPQKRKKHSRRSKSQRRKKAQHNFCGVQEAPSAAQPIEVQHSIANPPQLLKSFRPTPQANVCLMLEQESDHPEPTGVEDLPMAGVEDLPMTGVTVATPSTPTTTGVETVIVATPSTPTTTYVIPVGTSSDRTCILESTKCDSPTTCGATETGATETGDEMRGKFERWLKGKQEEASQRDRVAGMIDWATGKRQHIGALDGMENCNIIMPLRQTEKKKLETFHPTLDGLYCLDDDHYAGDGWEGFNTDRLVDAIEEAANTFGRFWTFARFRDNRSNLLRTYAALWIKNDDTLFLYAQPRKKDKDYGARLWRYDPSKFPEGTIDFRNFICLGKIGAELFLGLTERLHECPVKLMNVLCKCELITTAARKGAALPFLGPINFAAVLRQKEPKVIEYWHRGAACGIMEFQSADCVFRYYSPDEEDKDYWLLGPTSDWNRHFA